LLLNKREIIIEKIDLAKILTQKNILTINYFKFLIYG